MEKIYVWEYNREEISTGSFYKYIFFIPCKVEWPACEYVIVGQSDFDPLLFYKEAAMNNMPQRMELARKIWKELQERGEYSLLQRDGQSLLKDGQ